ncbi:MAG: prenyltransferase/squalene oxidase repeat-containing protein [Planctomycetota bacterium]
MRNLVRVLVVSLLSLAAVAQSPPTVMHTTEDYLFLLRGDRLLQFDIHSLELLKSVVVPGEEVTQPGGSTLRTTTKPKTVSSNASGTNAAEMVTAGLDWLAAQQREDGSFPGDKTASTRTVHEIGVTGLAVLAFLGDGNTLREGPHRASLKRAVMWLREQQDPKTGQIGTANCAEFIYDHAIAALALSEAYGLSESKSLKQNVQLALNYLESHRNPYGVWRYQPRDGDNDTSVTTWCTMALRSGQDFGLEVNPTAMEMVQAWVEQMTDPTTGRVGYTERGGYSSRRTGGHSDTHPRENNEAMTAAGMLCLMLVGERDAAEPVSSAQEKLLMAKPPEWASGKVDEYAWYLGSLVAPSLGTKSRSAWNSSLLAACKRGQRADGSFEPIGVWAQDGGPVYSTSLLCLALETQIRLGRLSR